MKVNVSRITQPYWEAIPASERVDIRAAVPEGMTLHLVPGRRAPRGTTTVSLRTLDNRTIAETRGRDLAAMCRYVLRRGAEERGVIAGAVVVTDKDGWVTNLEDVG